jgi:hypothetical protein
MMSQQLLVVYHHADAEMMERVRSSLHAAGFAIWTDEDLVPANPEWEQACDDAIRNSAGCIVLLSPDSNGSPSVDWQLDRARAAGPRIYPVIGRGDEWSAIPKAFIGTQIIDVRANHDARMQRLIERIRSDLTFS